MNLKKLSKAYLNTVLTNLRPDQEEKIVNYNANSDYIVFSASSLKLGTFGSTDYQRTEEEVRNNIVHNESWTNYGAAKRVDNQGYVLVDWAEYNPWYTPEEVCQQRFRDDYGYYEKVNLNWNYRRNDDGLLEGRCDNGEWRAIQHSYHFFSENEASWTKGAFIINDNSLTELLQEAWLSENPGERNNDFCESAISKIDFPEGAVGAYSSIPALKKQTYFHGQPRVVVLPTERRQRNNYWLAIKKSNLKDQKWPVELVTPCLNYFPDDLRGKEIIKFFPDINSLINEIDTTEINNPNQEDNNEPTIGEDEAYELNQTFLALEISIKYEYYEENYGEWESNKLLSLLLKARSFNPSVAPELLAKIRQLLEEIDKLKIFLATDTLVIQQEKEDFNYQQINKRQQLISDVRELVQRVKEAEKRGNDEREQQRQERERRENEDRKRREEEEHRLAEIRQKVIKEIQQELRNVSHVDNSELELNNRNWVHLINKAASEAQLKRIRDQVIADIKDKREAKQYQENNKKLRAVIQRGQETNNTDLLIRIISQIEKFRGQKLYDELTPEINTLNTKLSQLTKDKHREYQKIALKIIEEKMKRNSVNDEQLSTEAKAELRKLHSEIITDPHLVDRAKDIISDNIGQIKAKSDLDELISSWVESDDPVIKKRLVIAIISFGNDSNKFKRQAYQSEINDINNLLGIGQKRKPKNTGADFPWLPTIILTGLTVALISTVLLLRKKKKVRK